MLPNLKVYSAYVRKNTDVLTVSEYVFSMPVRNHYLKIPIYYIRTKWENPIKKVNG